MSTAGPARRFRDRLDRTLEFLLAVLMAGMALAVLWQIVTRLVLRDPSSTVEELVRFGLVWVGLLGAAYGFGRRAHLTIDLLARRLDVAGRARLDLCTQLAVVAFALLVLVVGGIRLVDLTLDLGQTSAALQIPRGYVYLALPLSGAVILAYSAMDVVEGVCRPFRRERG